MHLISLLFWLFASLPLSASPVQVTLVAEQNEVRPGEPFRVGLHFQMDGEWHIYSDATDNPSPSPEVTWQLPDGFIASPLHFPKDKEFDTAGIPSWGYRHEVLLISEVTPPSHLTAGSSIELLGEVTWIACEKACIPGAKTVSLSLPATSLTTAPDPAVTALFAAFEPRGSIVSEINQILPAIGFAFLGGLILNLMPCVLPVISLKVMSFVRMAEGNRAHILRHGLAFTLGVLLSFWALAGSLLFLQSIGEAVGWGFQLQDPRFVALLAIILFVLGLSMVGVFEMGLTVAAKAGGLDRGGNAFWSGVLATVVATPCTGPFLGPVLGYVVTVSPVEAFTIFTSMGLGMASPYLLLSAFPGLVRFLPKPGPWMVLFKEVMGFLLFACVVWLAWVFGAQTDTLAMSFLLAGFVAIGAACWAYGKWAQPPKRGKQRIITYGFVVILVAIGLKLAIPNTLTDAHNDQWIPYSEEHLNELRAEGKPVFLDFTANWCIICQGNEIFLGLDDVEQRFEDLGVVRMRADWTRRGPAIYQALKRFGRNGVPLYVLYGRDSTASPLILPQTLTKGTIIEALNTLEAE